MDLGKGRGAAWSCWSAAEVRWWGSRCWESSRPRSSASTEIYLLRVLDRASGWGGCHSAIATARSFRLTRHKEVISMKQRCVHTPEHLGQRKKEKRIKQDVGNQLPFRRRPPAHPWPARLWWGFERRPSPVERKKKKERKSRGASLG
jgi:hypothetical protein